MRNTRRLRIVRKQDEAKKLNRGHWWNVGMDLTSIKLSSMKPSNVTKILPDLDYHEALSNKTKAVVRA